MVLAFYENIPGFSKLFIDFVNCKPFFYKRFPLNQFLNTPEFEQKILARNKDFHFRKILGDLILKSMDGIKLSPSQSANLNVISQGNTFTVNTGQQVGFLGGPLYTFFKSASAIGLTNFLNSRFNETKFVPIFWVEDNDSDLPEASTAYLLDGEYNVVNVLCEEPLYSQDKHPISEKIFTEAINKVVEKVFQCLANALYFSEVKGYIENIYVPNKDWGRSFVELLNLIFSEDGLLFLRASVVRQSGIFKDLILKELEYIPNTLQIINKANSILEENGYHIQAKVKPINLFIHSGDKRVKLEFDEASNDVLVGLQRFKKEEFLEFAEEHPNLFSPNVILRPIFQDYVLPTAINVCGPSEIGYTAQLLELYDSFEVAMPVFVQRHSATFIDRKAGKFLAHYNFSVLDIFKGVKVLEKEFLNLVSSDEIERKFIDLENEVNQAFDNFTSGIVLKDKTYLHLTEVTKHKVEKILYDYRKKIFSLKKKEYENEIKKLHQICNLIYPHSNLQERLISPVYFIARVGIANFRRYLKEICDNTNQRHIFCEMK